MVWFMLTFAFLKDGAEVVELDLIKLCLEPGKTTQH